MTTVTPTTSRTARRGALLAFLAIAVATVGMVVVTWGARQRLTAVEERVVPVLRFDRSLLLSLQQLHLVLVNVGESERMDEIDLADDLRDSILDRIERDGPSVLRDPQALDRLRVGFESYASDARRLAAKRVQAQPRTRRILAAVKGQPGDRAAEGTSEERALSAEQAEVDDAYATLEDRLNKDVDASEAALERELEAGRRSQQAALVAGALILLSSALGAWLSIRRERSPT